MRPLLVFTISLFSALFALADEVSTQTICHQYVQIEPIKQPSIRVPKCRVVDSTLYWEGVVTDEILYELSMRQSTKPIKKIQLNTFGGSTEASLEAAKYIRKNNIATEVRKGAVCMSACTLLFQAGTKRRAHALARFMYHPARWGEGWYATWSAECAKLKKENQNGREMCLNSLSRYVFEVQEITNLFFGVLI